MPTHSPSSKLARVLLGLFAALMLPVAASAQGGDDCSVPTPLTQFGNYTFDNQNATSSGYSGFCSQPGASQIVSDLFWRFTVPVSGDLEITTAGTSFNTSLSVFRGADCTTTLCYGHRTNNTGPGLSVLRIQAAQAGQELLIQVGAIGAAGGMGGPGVLNVQPWAGPCSTTPDDAFEDNDSFDVATRVVAGVYPGLFVSNEDPDYYVVSVPYGGRLGCSLRNLENGEATVGVLGAAGGQISGNFESFIGYSNNEPGPPKDFILRVLMDDPQGRECTPYTLDVFVGNICENPTPDAFEPNQDCLSPAPITTGFYPALTTAFPDPDYYSLTLQPGERMTAEQTSVFGDGIELLLLDSACSQVAGAGTTRRVLASNGLGSTPVDYVLRVGKNSFFGDPCGVYDLDVLIEPDPCLSLADDAFEDNDDLASAPTLTAGTYAGLNVSTGDPDYYRFELLPDEILRVTLASVDSASISVRLLDAGGNPTTVPWIYLTAVGSTVPVTYFWEVTVKADAPLACAAYEITIEEALSACILDPDDVLEDNDTAATATPLSFDPAGGTTTIDDLFVSDLDHDFYAFTVTANSRMTFSSSFGTEWRMHDAQGVPLTAFGTSSNRLFFASPTTPTTFIAEVRPRPSFGEQCFIYSVFFTQSDSGCDANTEDALEDNDTCLTSIALTDGVYQGLGVFATDPDYFSVPIASGNDLRVSVTQAVAGAASPFVAFYIDADSCEDQTRLFAINPSAEQQMGLYVLPNRTGTTRNIIVAITAGNPGSPLGCATYDLEVSGTMTAPPERLGSVYCRSLPNSTGETANLSAWGSPVAADNRVTFACTGLPTHAIGYLLTSRTQGFVPAGGGSAGNLCLGGRIQRFVRPGEIQDTFVFNDLDIEVDLQDLPMGSGSTSAQAGETWNFQYWTRDAQNGALTSNLSNGLEVIWQ